MHYCFPVPSFLASSFSFPRISCCAELREGRPALQTSNYVVPRAVPNVTVFAARGPGFLVEWIQYLLRTGVFSNLQHGFRVRLIPVLLRERIDVLASNKFPSRACIV